jgi:hypothetical protein
MLVAVVGVGGTLAGGFLSGGLGIWMAASARRGEHAKWLREQRLALYSEILQACGVRIHPREGSLEELKEVLALGGRVAALASREVANDFMALTAPSTALTVEERNAGFNRLAQRIREEIQEC